MPAVLALALLPAGGVQAQMLCSKPLQPLCSTDLQDFANPTERTRCVTDTEKYLEELRAYRACLKDAIATTEESLKKAEAFKSCLADDGENCGIEEDNSL